MSAIVITGPTASGKSDLAASLASELDIEIISADSAQVYRGMDIGTAKPAVETLAQIPHHLIDIREPSEPYSAAGFRADAIALVKEIRSRGRVPVICGGTMLYLKALKEGLAVLPEADDTIRAEIEVQAASSGWDSVHRELAMTDPESAARIKPTDTQRLQRAVEVFRLTGRTLTDLHKAGSEPCPFALLEIALIPDDRTILHNRIAARFHQMLEAGLIAEVETLYNNPKNHIGLPAIRAVGYRQIWSYLDGLSDKEEMTEKAIAATRQLAKRQYTWLRSWQGLEVLSTADPEQVLKIVTSSTILR